jgi:hypothetical protein
MLFIIMQQVQPACIMALMQSQQAWIIWQHFGSPEVQVIRQPLSVISHLHRPMVRLHVQTSMPFIIMQQLTMEPESIVHRFCIMPQAIWSSQVQVMVMPVLDFSILNVQRGTIIMFGIMVPVVPPIVPIPVAIAGMLIPARSIIIMLMVVLHRDRKVKRMDRAGLCPYATRHPLPAGGNAWEVF